MSEGRFYDCVAPEISVTETTDGNGFLGNWCLVKKPDYR
ncbi:MAG: hypothetical protein ACJAS1_005670 [Oleiphilaceae bacterium]|jgi:hypothetical protein